jgi:hypothetical protein
MQEIAVARVGGFVYSVEDLPGLCWLQGRSLSGVSLLLINVCGRQSTLAGTDNLPNHRISIDFCIKVSLLQQSR